MRLLRIGVLLIAGSAAVVSLLAAHVALLRALGIEQRSGDAVVIIVPPVPPPPLPAPSPAVPPPIADPAPPTPPTLPASPTPNAFSRRAWIGVAASPDRHDVV